MIEAFPETHPLTLSFRDRVLELAYRRADAQARRGVMQVGTIVLGVLYAAFGALDVLVFKQHIRALLWIRFGVALPLMLAVWPIVLMPRFRAVYERRAQEILLWLGCVATFGILAMAGFVAVQATLQQVMVGSLGMLVTLTFLYGFTQMRFIYSASLGLFASGTGFFFLYAFLHAPSSVWVSIVTYGFAVNLGGFWLGRTLEMLSRRDFAQKVAIANEKDRSERLLANALPAAIAHRLRDADLGLGAERAALAERHEDVTVLVADLVGFTPLAEKLAPEDLAALLDRLFSRFDELCTQRGVEKIKTLGDAWIAAAGAPDACEDHAQRAARLSLDMIAAVEELQSQAPSAFAVRIGIASGSAIAGVIGRIRFAYDLWGEAVDEAKAMEHGGAPAKVRVSERTATRLGAEFAIVSEPTADGIAHWLVQNQPSLPVRKRALSN